LQNGVPEKPSPLSSAIGRCSSTRTAAAPGCGYESGTRRRVERQPSAQTNAKSPPLALGAARHEYAFRFYGLGAVAVKTTVEISGDLYRRAKSEAALRGRKLKDLVEEGLRLVLETPRESRHHNLAELMKRARGTVNSGITDLASNPEHLKTFARNASRHR
jgi:hypothetical protein